MHGVAGVVFSLGWISSQAPSDQVISDKERGFTLTLPKGFTRHLVPAHENPRIIHSFIRGNPNDNETDLFLMIERMGGTIGRERLTPAAMPPGFKGRLFTARWQGLEIDALEVPDESGLLPVVTYLLQIPLKREAIQVKLLGARDRQGELYALIPQVLDGLRGESNWVSASDLASSKTYGIALLVAFCLIVLSGILALWWISRKVPKGVILALSVGLWIAGWQLGEIRIREVVGFSGCLQTIGFAGAILGLIDLFRRREPKSPEPTPPPPA